ncbi:peptidylprolyl isomerase [Aureivirga marina]|uniref:peptidylprolyl isomerase n=1 Tax=Aureivirga marina TaxID=1182451 RepID=UPI0018CAFC10|nr:peptidylprolyl isomerase [Aureivirga marina]
MKKNHFHKIVFISLFLIFISCGENTNQEKVKENIHKTEIQKQEKKKIQEEIIKKESLEISYEFLEQYGKDNPETKLRIKTRLGDIDVTLFEDTPIHRASFIFLVKEGYFDTTSFHRVVEEFIIQGGDSDNKRTAEMRKKFQQYRILPEFRKNRKHKQGALAAARSWNNNPKKLSTPFEFYIVLSPKGEHHLDGEHTVFGQVTKGFDVIEKISKVKVDREEWPFVDVHMKIEILE